VPIKFEYDGKSMDPEDLPLTVFADIEDATGVTWYNLGMMPLRYAKAGEMLARECAKVVGVEIPDPLTPKVFSQLFEVTDEPNLPVEMSDGMPDNPSGGV
jgi:hypothetical protein